MILEPGGDDGKETMERTVKESGRGQYVMSTAPYRPPFFLGGGSLRYPGSIAAIETSSYESAQVLTGTLQYATILNTRYVHLTMELFMKPPHAIPPSSLSKICSFWRLA